MALAATAIVLVAVMATATSTAGVACGGEFGGGAADGYDGGVNGGGGLKEAIQDLYAEIVAFESVNGGGGGGGAGHSSDVRLDDVASAKAKFVSDSLRRMIGNGEADDAGVTAVAARVASSVGGGGGVDVDDAVVERKLRSKQKEVIDALKRYDETHGGLDEAERTAKHVEWLMDKCVEIALAKSATATTAAAKPADPPPVVVDMDALQRRFNDLLEQFERSRTSAATVCCRGVYGHKSQTSPKTRSPPTPRPPPPTTRPPSTVRWPLPLTTAKPTTQPRRRPSPRSVGRFRLSHSGERSRVDAVHR